MPRGSGPRWTLVEREEEAESSEEEPIDDEEEENDEDERQAADEAAAGPSSSAQHAVPPKKSISISLHGNKQMECHVCGQKGHKAGFVGAVYLDCPNRPCYLCKEPGHTTATCPYRVAPGHNCTPAASTSATGNLAAGLAGRERSGRATVPPLRCGRWRVEAAILKLHSRRCCCLEFHPSNDSIVVSGDKKGHVAVWNYERVHERTLHQDVNHALVNTIRFLPWLDTMACCTASSDGTVKTLDLDTGLHRTLLDLNPGGWHQGIKDWGMAYGCAASCSLGLVLAGDSSGRVHLLDPRVPAAAVNCVQLHKRGNKVVSVDVNPLDERLVLTAGNDHTARIFDIRAAATRSEAGPGGSSRQPGPAPCSAPSASPGAAAGAGSSASSPAAGTSHAAPRCAAELAVMPHPRVVNAASFSPCSGTKVLTTCQDNRIRVWDYVLSADRPPNREIVHSHDFNRYLTPFKAEWDPKDPTERLFVCGRYISEDYGGVALHPIDLMDASSGRLLCALTDPNLTTITPVNKPHPRRDILVSGSSRSLYLWAPAPEEEEEQGGSRAASASSKQHSSAAQSCVFFDADPGSLTKKKGKRSRGSDDDD